MLFVTNRTLSSRRRRAPRPVKFALDDNQAGQSIFFCRRLADEDYVEIGNDEFLDDLRESQPQQILLYIHGFNNLPEKDIFPRAEKLQAMFDTASPNLVQVVPAIWPCDNDAGIVKDYFDDQMAADASGVAFARALEKLRQRQIESTMNSKIPPCLKRINVLAHSMGNRVYREALRIWCGSILNAEPPLIFRNSFLAAADVVNETLQPGQSGRLISTASRNVVVYYASDDLALRASKIANASQASRRLGHSGPEDLSKVARNVVSIDCDDINTAYDRPAGHAYFLDNGDGRPGALFEHMLSCMTSGRVVTPPPPLVIAT